MKITIIAFIIGAFVGLNISLFIMNVWFLEITVKSYNNIAGNKIERVITEAEQAWIDEFAPLITPETAP